jgi:hypothetical protein
VKNNVSQCSVYSIKTKYLLVSFKNLKFLQNVLSTASHNHSLNFLRILNRLEVCVSARAVKLESPCALGIHFVLKI